VTPVEGTQAMPAPTCAALASMPLQFTCATVRPYLSRPPLATMRVGRSKAKAAE
jgi:hypothetical protein